ncbi:MAG TPA: calcium-binding protein [Solirubrobacteraceae bacterium]
MIRLAGGLAAAATLAAPAPVFASTAGVTEGVLRYTGGTEANTVTITRSGAQFVVSDTTATETPQAGCSPGAGGTVVCDATGITQIETRTNGGADTVRIRAATPARLIGGTGDDLLSGGGGADVLDGGSGADELGGGSAGRDTVTYAARTAAVTADFDGVADDGNATDASGGRRDDIYDSVDVIVGGKAADTLVGDARATTLDGGDGNDTLNGGLGADDLIGGPGNDTVRYTTRSLGVTVDIDAAADDGSVEDASGTRRDRVDLSVEHLTGGLGNDTLIGSAAANTLNGGPGGNDTLLGLGGPDDLLGGSGNDTVSYERSTGTVIADLDGTRDDGGTGDANRTDLIRADVENLIGGRGADQLTGNSENNVFDGGFGPDTIVGGAGARDTLTYAKRTRPVEAELGTPFNGNQDDKAASGVYDTVDASVEDVIGTGGPDELAGSGAPNRVFGGGGDDVLRGANGADVLDGQDGVDRAEYSDHGENLLITLDGNANDGATGEGDNVLTEDVVGGNGGDVIRGNAGPNRLDGGPGNDSLNGQGGADDLAGGPGANDAVTYFTLSVSVSASIDGVANDGPAGEGDDIDASVETIYGGQADDALDGGTGPQMLNGGPGNDVLDGKDGDDQLIGAGGADTLTGGDGRDTVFYVERTAGVVVDIDGAADDGDASDNAGPEDATRDNVTTSVEVVLGSQGSDTLTAADSGSTLDGFTGNDSLNGGPGDDTLRGGGGSDSLIGYGGADELDGGEDLDSASYAERSDTQNTNVSLDGAANDGGPGENDNVYNVETLYGGAGADVFTGSSAAETFFGGANTDTLHGGGGDDHLDGEGDLDTLYGEAGNDSLRSMDGAGGDTNYCGEDPGEPTEDGDAATGELDDIYEDCESITAM